MCQKVRLFLSVRTIPLNTVDGLPCIHDNHVPSQVAHLVLHVFGEAEEALVVDDVPIHEHLALHLRD